MHLCMLFEFEWNGHARNNDEVSASILNYDLLKE